MAGFSALINFPADPSVGCMSFGMIMEIPDFRECYPNANDPALMEDREQTRASIKALYELLQGEWTCNVLFQDEI